MLYFFNKENEGITNDQFLLHKLNGQLMSDRNYQMRQIDNRS